MRALVLLAAVSSVAAAGEPQPGERLPPIALRDANGNAVKLPGDRPTVIVFGSFS